MADMTRFDDMFFGILQNCEKIEPFLEVVFSFLARRTDFFRIMHSKTDKMGFPTGVAEKMVLKIFKKYQGLVLENEERKAKIAKEKRRKKKESSRQSMPDHTSSKDPPVDPMDTTDPTPTPQDVPPVNSTVDVKTSNLVSSHEEVKSSLCNTKGDSAQKPSESLSETVSPTESPVPDSKQDKPGTAPECFNGGVTDNYMWSQTGGEVDVRVLVGNNVKGKDVLVEIKNSYLKVALKNRPEEGPKVLVDGELQWKVHAEESMWTLIPGEHIHISLDKVEDRWWTCVIKGDKEIDKSKIDTTRDISEFDEQTQSDYQKVMYDHRQKMMGKPTSDEMKTHEVLKKAWDAPNSPFAGTPFDPSKVNISGNIT